MRNSHSAYLFTFINILEQVTRFIFNYHQIDYFIVNNNNYYSYEKYTVENDYKNIVGSRINVLITGMFLYPVCSYIQYVLISCVFMTSFHCKCEIRNQHTCLPLLTFGSKSLGSFLIFTNLFTLL